MRVLRSRLVLVPLLAVATSLLAGAWTTAQAARPARAASGLQVSTRTLDFARVAPGAKSTASVMVSNSGTAAITITKVAAPAAPFTAGSSLAANQQLQPGASVTVKVTVVPTTGEKATGSWSVTGNDGSGAHTVALVVNNSSWSGPLANPLGCITVRNYQLANNTPIVLYPCTGSGAQTWRFSVANSIKLADGSAGPKCIGVPGAATARQTTVVLFQCNRGKSQSWYVDHVGRLHNPHSNKCLDVKNASAQSYSSIVINDCSASPSQQWDPVPLISARGLVSSGMAAPNRLCLTIASARQGTPATIDRCTFARGQIIGHVGQTLRTYGACLQVGTAKAGSAVYLQKCTGTPGQTWTPGPNGRIYNPQSKLCLDDPKGTRQPGFRLQMYPCNGNRPQRWTLPG